MTCSQKRKAYEDPGAAIWLAMAHMIMIFVYRPGHQCYLGTFVVRLWT